MRRAWTGSAFRRACSFLKEVIQPQVPLRLPCYDFIPVINHTLDVYPPCGSNQRFRVQWTPMM